MSTELHKTGHAAGQPPIHEDVSFEPRDVKPRTILVYLFCLALAVIASFAVCVYILRYTTHLAVESEPPPPPIRQGLGPTLPPEPRLQGVPGHENDPQQDLRDKIKADSEANEKLGWIDEKAGIAQIPVEDAMKIIAEKGLPVTPAPPAEKKKVSP
jgi:hypothetical protein